MGEAMLRRTERKPSSLDYSSTIHCVVRKLKMQGWHAGTLNMPAVDK